jgi:hypothetical protein
VSIGIERPTHPVDSERLSGDLDADARTHGGDRLAAEPEAFAGEEREDPGRRARLRRCPQPGSPPSREPEFLPAREDFVGRLLQDVVLLLRVRTAPSGKGGLGCGDRVVELFECPLRILADDIARVGRLMLREALPEVTQPPAIRFLNNSDMQLTFVLDPAAAILSMRGLYPGLIDARGRRAVP